MIWVHIILSVVYIFAGFVGFVTFIIYQNYQASVWGFVMCVTACILLRIHLLEWIYEDQIVGTRYVMNNDTGDFERDVDADYDGNHPDALQRSAALGFYVFAFGVSGFIYNIIIFIFFRPPILPIADSTILSAIWCFLTFKTGALLFWNARKYADLEIEDVNPIFPVAIECIKMIWLHIILNMVDMLAGCAGLVKCIEFQNYEGCIWSIALIIIGYISLKIHLLEYQNKIHTYLTAFGLEFIGWLGYYVFACGFTGFIYNIIMILLRPSILPITLSTILSTTAIWSFLTFKTGFILCWNARKYADRAYIMGLDSDSSGNSEASSD